MDVDVDDFFTLTIQVQDRDGDLDILAILDESDSGSTGIVVLTNNGSGAFLGDIRLTVGIKADHETGAVAR